MYLNKQEIEISEEYLSQGYIVRPVADTKILNRMSDRIVEFLKERYDLETYPFADSQEILNNAHKFIGLDELNKVRLEVINHINIDESFRESYYLLTRPYLDALVGNELAMQKRINLSIQIPQDESSLLAIHADTWSGDSPYEVVVWLPLVDCYKTKSMYLLQPEENNKLLKEINFSTDELLYKSCESKLKWLDVNYGEVLIFNQGLPHGNRVNVENDTRWTLNCRFKSIFSPYNDKKLGEFFQPITLRAASKAGISYQYPIIK